MFKQPTKLSDVDIAFPASVCKLMPSYEAIPCEFKRDSNPYVRFQQQWFFSGLNRDQIPAAKDGIDLNEALRHLEAIQRSFEPKHEHKQAAVAYLASLWLVTANA